MSETQSPTNHSPRWAHVAIQHCANWAAVLQLNNGTPIEVWPYTARYSSFCMPNCGLRKNSPRLSVNCDQQCRRLRTTAYRTYGARGHTKPKLHQFDLSLYLLQTWSYIIPATNQSSGVWALSLKCGNNWHLWDCVGFCYRPMLVA